MLNSNIPQYIITTKNVGNLWIQGYVLFARLKKNTVVFTKARKAKQVMANNVKYVDLPQGENIIKKDQKYVWLNMNVGQKEILKTFSKIRELIITEIRKGFLRNLRNHEKLMDIKIQKLIGKEIQKNVIVMNLLDWLSNWVILINQSFVKDVKKIVRHMLTTMIIKSHWMSFGFVENVMEKSIEYLYQRERLNLETSNKEDAIVQPAEETCREEPEAVLPPLLWSVSLAGLKVIEWLRHTAACTFYQGELLLALYKSFLIEVDICEADNTAQALLAA